MTERPSLRNPAQTFTDVHVSALASVFHSDVLIDPSQTKCRIASENTPGVVYIDVTGRTQLL